VIDPSKYHCDAALVGFPDAGKSTLFNALTGRDDSQVMPRFAQVTACADRHLNGKDIVLADIGGISRGVTPAGTNPGAMWLAFAENARALVFVVALRKAKSRSLGERCVRDYAYLLKTATAYKESFAEKRRIAALNRFPEVSGAEAEEASAFFRARFPETAALTLCAASGEGCGFLAELLL
jgi:GTPase involved in cell partitioning and DNA repair